MVKAGEMDPKDPFESEASVHFLITFCSQNVNNNRGNVLQIEILTSSSLNPSFRL